MPERVRIDALRHLGRIGTIVVLCLVLTSCGNGGDDDNDPDPTATTEEQIASQPTQVPELTTELTATVRPFRLIPASPTATDESGEESTPDDEESDSSGATPPDEESASPESSPDSEATEIAEETETPEMESTQDPNSVTGSDGTSGPGDAGALLESPAGSPVASPASSSAPEVQSCDVVEAPQFTGDSSAFVVVEEVNFRIGPGSGCDSVLDDPLSEGVELTVLSDPVIRADIADGIEWVQVEVDGEIGWVATEFIESAE